jgi:hypothetical protein
MPRHGIRLYEFEYNLAHPERTPWPIEIDHEDKANVCVLLLDLYTKYETDANSNTQMKAILTDLFSEATEGTNNNTLDKLETKLQKNQVGSLDKAAVGAHTLKIVCWRKDKPPTSHDDITFDTLSVDAS